jgi:hypothetical protein
MAIFSLVLTCFDVALYCQLHKKCLFSGFATYVEYLGVEAVQPEIHLLDQFIISEIQVRRDKLVEIWNVNEGSLISDFWISLRDSG